MTAWPRFSLRPVMAILAPSLAKSRAVASPMPEVPPVMRATLSCRRIHDLRRPGRPRPGGRAKLAEAFSSKIVAELCSAGRTRASAPTWIRPGPRRRPPGPCRSRTTTHHWPDTERLARFLPACPPGPAASLWLPPEICRQALPVARASLRSMAVSVSPGQMQFTRIFCGP